MLVDKVVFLEVPDARDDNIMNAFNVGGAK